MKQQNFYAGLSQESLVCARCGYCRVDCPTYQLVGWESASPRARLKIAGDLGKKEAIASPEQVRSIFQCTFCGRCREECSTDIDTVKVWKHLRAQVAAAGKLPANLQPMVNNVLQAHNITGEEAGKREMWLESLEEKYRERVGRQAEVLYFTGCTGSLFPVAYKIPQSFVQILEAAGLDYTLLGAGEMCCGFPLLGAGEFARGHALIRGNMELITGLGVKRVVTTCPSCYHTLKHDWVEVLQRELPFEVLHASQYLELLLQEKKLQFKELPERVTYHDPCDLGRNSGIYEPPRRVLQSIPGLELVEMHRNRDKASCCGGGGNLEAVDAELVSSIALKRLQEAAEVGAQTVVSSCQQCKRTLYSAARKNKLRVSVLDLAELVLKALMI